MSLSCLFQRRIRPQGVDVQVRGGELAMYEGRVGGRRRGHQHERGPLQAGMQPRGRERRRKKKRDYLSRSR